MIIVIQSSETDQDRSLSDVSSVRVLNSSRDDVYHDEDSNDEYGGSQLQGMSSEDVENEQSGSRNVRVGGMFAISTWVRILFLSNFNFFVLCGGIIVENFDSIDSK